MTNNFKAFLSFCLGMLEHFLQAQNKLESSKILFITYCKQDDVLN